MNTSWILKALILAASAVLLVSCAASRTGPPRSASSPKNIGGEALLQAQAAIDRGDYAKGLLLYSEAYNAARSEGIADQYMGAGSQVRKDAELAFQRGDYTTSGSLYSLLLRSRITVEDFSAALSFDAAYLQDRITACVKRLTESGLVKYRDEKLDEAIALWEMALSFDPDNRSLKKAITTAVRQQQMLRSIK